uniref:Uncharacterized protein n=1 Tax=uncultured Thiotrichaceae bacterium TaxID=298394 RepID=A0A6S6UB94_9GAMM|nr:MAG: Unknown protein [uncultured Thiotrichaceae bacterium]
MPNSVVKRVIADGSVGIPHVRVGQCQARNTKALLAVADRAFFTLVIQRIIKEHLFEQRLLSIMLFFNGGLRWFSRDDML